MRYFKRLFVAAGVLVVGALRDDVCGVGVLCGGFDSYVLLWGGKVANGVVGRGLGYKGEGGGEKALVGGWGECVEWGA